MRANATDSVRFMNAVPVQISMITPKAVSSVSSALNPQLAKSLLRRWPALGTTGVRPNVVSRS